MKTLLFIARDRLQLAEFRAEAEGLPLRITAETRDLREALDAYRRDPADIVVADLFLGEANGLDALKALKKVSERVTFLLVTRVRDKTLPDRAFRYGAADVLTYPMSPGLLRETLQHRLAWLNTAALHAPKA